MTCFEEIGEVLSKIWFPTEIRKHQSSVVKESNCQIFGDGLPIAYLHVEGEQSEDAVKILQLNSRLNDLFSKEGLWVGSTIPMRQLKTILEKAANQFNESIQS